MTETKASTAAFLLRLSTLITLDENCPDVSIGRSYRTHLDEEGRMQCEHSGAEAILIVRGPDAERDEALRALLARLDS